MSALSSLADLSASKLNTGDLIQQIAWLYYLKKGEDAKGVLEKITGFRVGYELYQRMTREREVEALRASTILAIADFIKKNPRASEAVMAKEVQKQIQLFTVALEQL